MAITLRLLTMALAGCALAGTALAQPESLLDVYQRALQNDPAIREAEANYLATAEVKPQARSSLLPDLNLSAGLSHQFSESPGGAVVGGVGAQSQAIKTEFDSDRDNWSVGLTQTIFNWAQFATLKQADKRVTRAETDFAVAKQDLVIRVSTRYFNVLAAEDNLASAVAAREAIARQLEQAQRRFEVGLIAITDVQQSQAAFDDAVATEIDAQRLLATAQEFLREIVGEIVADLASPIDDLPLLTPDPANAEQWVQSALESNLALMSSRIAADIAQDDIDIQRAGRYPTLSLSAAYNDSTTDQVVTNFPFAGDPIVNPSRQAPEGYNWSFDLRFPIYTGGFNRSKIQQSVYQHRSATEALQRVARQTERETRDAYLGVISEISRVRALRQAVESAGTALRATEAGFEVGTQTTVDVLAAQNNLRRVETTYSRSRYDYLLNVLALKQAAGSLEITDIEQIDGWLQR
jgi:outer membrane protein